MCGIVGYLGKKEAKDIIIKGLKRLEYRGYDSAGISTLQNNKLEITKTQGKVGDLSAVMDDNSHLGGLGIGHTRWATHGVPNQKNAHPHFDNSGKFSLVHNGIIENSTILKRILKNKKRPLALNSSKNNLKKLRKIRF